LTSFHAHDLVDDDNFEQLLQILHRVTVPSLPPLEVPEELVQACESGGCVLYAGSGLSARSGLPTSVDFVTGLLDWAAENKFIDQTSRRSLKLNLEQGDIDIVRDSIANNLKRGDMPKLHRYFRDTLLNPSCPLSKSHRKLKKIGFAGVLTTNFDDLLERSFRYPVEKVYTHTDSEDLLTHLTRSEFFILKPYGTLEKAETVLVSPSQYEANLPGNLAFSEFMTRLFVSRTILFIGSSLDGIEGYFESIGFRNVKARLHYALVAVAGSAWKAKADYLKRRYGIEVLPYAMSKGHSEVDTFLNSLAK
ncbi:MAG: SIR2 family protein, partial [bacterium]|nr:SIR2 family protein [bacterium]